MKKTLMISILAFMLILLTHTAFVEARELRFYLSETNSITADVFNVLNAFSTGIGITALVDYKPLPNLYLSLKSINIFNNSAYYTPYEPYIFLDATYLVNNRLALKLTAGYPGAFYGTVEYKFVDNERLDFITQLSGGYSASFDSSYISAGLISSYSITPKLSLTANADFRYVFKYTTLEVISELALVYNISDYFNLQLIVGDMLRTIFYYGGSTTDNLVSLSLMAGTGLNLDYHRKHGSTSIYDYATNSIPELVLKQLPPYNLFNTIFNHSSYFNYVSISDSFKVSYNFVFQTTTLTPVLENVEFAVNIGSIYDVSDTLDISVLATAVLNDVFNNISADMAVVAIANYEFVENWVASIRLGFHADDVFNESTREIAYSFAPQIKYSINDDLSLKLTSSFGISQNSFTGIRANLNLEYVF